MLLLLYVYSKRRFGVNGSNIALTQYNKIKQYVSESWILLERHCDILKQRLNNKSLLCSFVDLFVQNNFQD